MVRHRIRLEMARDMLIQIRNGVSMQCDILRKSNVSYGVGTDILPALLDNEYVDTIQQKHERTNGIELSYIITDKGNNLIKDLSEDLIKYSWLLLA